eukprot:TRINITY_DN11206_c0_g1_i1.p1 TRINITY_DN11206_c0_g1~~TRINITY_DN11206_c0_g1_i1.p1  ORF type:complete len:323 (+),score=82.64 TRINITY_DN11206_c0_g1_i1:449-1417(+)
MTHLATKGNIAKQLTHLDLAKTMITHDGLESISQSLLNLKTLSIAGIDHIEDIDIIGLKLPQLASLNLNYCQLTDSGLLHVAKECPSLTQLEMAHYDKHKVNFTNAGMAHLANHLKNLRSLEISELNVDDEGIATLSTMSSLTSLSLLRMSKLTNKSLASVGNLAQLEKLWITNASAVGDEGIKSIANLKHINDLCISNANIGDEGLKIIGASFPELVKLRLFNNPFGNAGIEGLASLKKLEILELGGNGINSKVTDTSIKSLEAFADTLTQLDLTGHPLTDESVTSLIKLKNLTKLTIINTKISSKGTTTLAKNLTRCTIK